MVQLRLAVLLAMAMAMTMTIVKATPLVQPDGDDAVLEPRLLFQARDVEFERSWLNFKEKYGKQYESDTLEARRMSIFQANLQVIDAHNKLYARGEKSYTMGVNEFTDLEVKEFVAAMTGYRATNKSRSHGATYRSPANEYVTLTLADSVDWRTKGYVTEIKNQGQCGSCWAFSTTGSLEGQHFKSTGKLVSLSEQNLLDCSQKYGNMGCQGGLMDSAFQYIIDNGGIDTEASYPYEERDDKPCRYSASNVGATMTSFTDVTSGDESALQEAVASVGPVSVAIDASLQSFQMYASGLYDEPACSSTELDHGVLAVGYGTTDGQDSWIVKNSWGATWGDQGYIYMSRNKDNQCGIATAASYPVV